MIKFTKIGKFSSAVKNLTHRCRFVKSDDSGEPIYDYKMELPTVPLIGTVKLHGTNASFVYRKGEITFQSKNNVVTPFEDNYGFARYMQPMHPYLHGLVDSITEIDVDDTVTVYGEWAGKGIQGGVGIGEIEKSFFIFAIKIGEGDDYYWLDMEKWSWLDNPTIRIYNLYDEKRFPVYRVDLDLENPNAITEYLTERTLEVENECPVAKKFGSQGIGEGIVWRPASSTGFFTTDSDSGFMFKVKGEKHSDNKNKNGKLVSVDPEKLASINEFVDVTCTDHRLEKGIDYLNESNMEISFKSISVFLKWVYDDIALEEADVIAASGLERKEIGKPIANKARNWYIQRMEQEAIGK